MKPMKRLPKALKLLDPDRHRDIPKVKYMVAVHNPSPLENLHKFNTIVLAEISRLEVLSQTASLSMSETKRLEMLMSTHVKYSAELRKSKEVSLLEGLTEAEVLELAQTAMNVLAQVTTNTTLDTVECPVLPYNENDDEY